MNILKNCLYNTFIWIKELLNTIHIKTINERIIKKNHLEEKSWIYLLYANFLDKKLL